MSEKELVAKIKSGDENAFKELTDKYQKLVLNTCYAFSGNKTDAEDITQEVFITAFLTADKFKENSKISTWLYRIAVNKSLNFIRDNKKRKIFGSIENFFSGNEGKTELQIADETTEDKEIKEAEEEKLRILRKVVDELPERQKTVFILNKYENLSYKRISEITGLSLASVEGLIHRAKKNTSKKILKYYEKKRKF